MKKSFEFLPFLPGVEYDHGSAPNKQKTRNGKVKFIKEKKKNQK